MNIYIYIKCTHVCVCVCPSAALSDGDSEFLQHADSFLLVLLAGQPEVVLVLHDVGQHGAAQEHHVFTPGGVLDPDLEFLQGRMRQRGERRIKTVLGSHKREPSSRNDRRRRRLQERASSRHHETATPCDEG